MEPVLRSETGWPENSVSSLLADFLSKIVLLECGATNKNTARHPDKKTLEETTQNLVSPDDTNRRSGLFCVVDGCFSLMIVKSAPQMKFKTNY